MGMLRSSFLEQKNTNTKPSKSTNNRLLQLQGRQNTTIEESLRLF